MSGKPDRATGYSRTDTDRARRTLLHLVTYLGDLLDHVVLIGGLVPALSIDDAASKEPAEAHVGTLDVDLGLELAIFDDTRYDELADRLGSAGFEPDVTEKGTRSVQRWASVEDDGAAVDFLVPPVDDDVRVGRIKHLRSDLGAIVADGLPLAFRQKRHLELRGVTLRGEEAVRRIWVVDAPAFVALKALAFRGRGVNKDAYDIAYVLFRERRAPIALGREFAILLEDPAAGRALDALREGFGTENAVGPRRAAEFLGRRDDHAFRADIVSAALEFVRGASG